MFGIGFGEMLMIAVVLLIAVGPKKMPTFMKAVGKGLREFRRATRELKNAAGIDELMRDDTLRNPLKAKNKPKPRPVYQMTNVDKLKERPKAGTDISHASDHPEAARAYRPPPPPKPDVLPDADGPVVEEPEATPETDEAKVVAREDSLETDEAKVVAREDPVAVGAGGTSEGSAE